MAPFIGRLKGSISHWINYFHNPGGDFAWQGGYGIFTVADPDLDNICGYVRNQEAHHQKGTLIPAYEEMCRRLPGPTAG